MPFLPHLTTCLVVLCAVVFSAAVASAAPPEVGQKAPPLSVEALLNAPQGASASWEDLEGKIVVVEFWATWCGPCVAAIPHLNELTEQFADEDVVFISINVGEEAEVVEPFLKRRPITGWVGLDPDDTTAKAYGVRVIPNTFIVGRDGRILADTYPTVLEAEHLRSALAGDVVDLPKRPVRDTQVVPLESADTDAPATIVEAWLRPTAATGEQGSSAMGGNKITITNATADSIVNQAYNGRLAGAILAIEAELPEGRFDVYIKVPAERAFQVDELLWETVAFAFGLVRYKEMRETAVFELQGIEGEEDKRPAVEAGRPSAIQGFEDNAYGLDIKGTYPSHLAQYLDLGLFRTPLVTSMDRGEQFDVELKIPHVEPDDDWEARQLEVANKELARYGLVLVPATRPLEFTVVARRGSYAEESARATTRPGGPAPE